MRINKNNKISDLIELYEVKSYVDRSANERGKSRMMATILEEVKAYNGDLMIKELINAELILNGAGDGEEFIRGGCYLIYNYDFCKNFMNTTEFKTIYDENLNYNGNGKETAYINALFMELGNYIDYFIHQLNRLISGQTDHIYIRL